MENSLKQHHSPLPFYVAGFFMAMQEGVYIVVLPFLIRSIGGTDKNLGLCAGATSGAYLIVCILSIHLVDRFNAKRIVQLASSMMALSMSLILTIVLLNRKGIYPFNTVWSVTIAAALLGSAMAIYWGPLMGWLSTGYEGKELNRRLAFFNVSWSAGLVVGPFVGGIVTEISHMLGLAVVIAIMISAFLTVTFAAASPKKSSSDAPLQNPNDISHLLPKFKIVSNIALLVGSICVGLSKTQFALLLTIELGFTESNFGMAMAFMCLAYSTVFFMLSRTHRWHYKLSLFIFAQLITLSGLVMIMAFSSLPVLICAITMLGLGNAFIYNSQQFYGVTGSVKRLAPMVLHEVFIAAGMVVGAVAGGFIAEALGRRIAPYMLCFIAIAIGLVIQLAIWFLVPTKKLTKPQTLAP